MSLAHLSDMELQAYCEGTLAKEHIIKQHLESCSLCRRKLDDYALLYSALGKQPQPALHHKFADSVMAQIKPAMLPAKESPLFWLLLTVMGVVSTVAALIYFVDFSALLGRAEEPPFLRHSVDPSIVESFKSLAANQGEMLSILFFAGLILLFFGILDSLLKKKKVGRASLFSV